MLDLNENSSSMAARHLRRFVPHTVGANVLDPPPLGDARFDSAAANYLFHCLPGHIESKAATVSQNARAYLAPGGVFFGSTILGSGVLHGRIGRRLMRIYNAKGIFANAEDDEGSLERGLASYSTTSRSK